ncbi:MAG: hypothetical protein JXQ71_09550 [Verrucomicrobia bacterium]|nr:hypothetical protein [Verrucomicrobiota bacterium]
MSNCANGTCWVELANGHRVLAFLTGRSKRTGATPEVGSRVKLGMSPFDMSKGRILGPKT